MSSENNTASSGSGNFEIYFARVKNAALDIDGQSKKVRALQDELQDIVNNLTGPSAVGEIRAVVNKLKDDTVIHAQRLSKESQTILECMNLYETAEAELLGQSLPEDGGGNSGSGGGSGESGGTSFTPETPDKPVDTKDPSKDLPKSGWVEDFDYVGKDGTIYHYDKAYINSDGKITAYKGKTSWKSSFMQDYKVVKGNVYVKQPWEFKNAKDKMYNGKPVRKVYQQGVGWLNADKQEGLAKRTLTLLEQEIAGVSEEATLFGAQTEGETSWAKGSASAKFLTAEGSASVGAGTYLVKNPDGSYSTAYGVQASASASAAVVALSASGFLGSTEKGLGVTGDAGVKLLSVNASASAGIGWVAGKGPQVDLNGSVGANLVEAKASGGVQLAKGLSAKATGSVSIGVGATGSVGYSDGKFHCTLGLSLGIGFKISIDIDLSAVTDAVKSAYNGFWDIFKSAFGEEVVNQVKKAAEEPVKNVVNQIVKFLKPLTKW